MTEGFGGIYRDDHYLKYKTYSDTQVLKIGNAKVWIKIQNGLIVYCDLGTLRTGDYSFRFIKAGGFDLLYFLCNSLYKIFVHKNLFSGQI